MNKKTQIAFTCHDLRRLKAQLARRNETGCSSCWNSNWRSTESVVTTHYAPDTIETQRIVSEQIDAKYNHIIRGNA